MSTIPAALQHLARQLLAHEAARGDSPGGDVAQAVRACENLRGPLTKLAGAAGFSSLLSRALSVAKRRTPSLEKLRVEADGSVRGVHEIQQGPKVADQGGEHIIGELLGLLVTLIGMPLTLSLVREAWPDMHQGVETLSPEVEKS